MNVWQWVVSLLHWLDGEPGDGNINVSFTSDARLSWLAQVMGLFSHS